MIAVFNVAKLISPAKAFVSYLIFMEPWTEERETQWMENASFINKMFLFPSSLFNHQIFVVSFPIVVTEIDMKRRIYQNDIQTNFPISWSNPFFHGLSSRTWYFLTHFNDSFTQEITFEASTLLAQLFLPESIELKFVLRTFSQTKTTTKSCRIFTTRFYSQLKFRILYLFKGVVLKSERITFDE